MADLKHDGAIQSDHVLAWHIYKKSTLDVIGLYVLLLCLVTIYVLPLWIDLDPFTQNVTERLLPPSWDERGSLRHFLGTDEFGRDFLARLLFGAQNTTKFAFAATMLAMAGGVTLGMISALSRSRLARSLVHHTFDILSVVPSLLIAFFAVGILGPSLEHVALAVGIAQLPRFIHETYLASRRELTKEYVKSELSDGIPRYYMAFTTILPNILNTISSAVTQRLCVAIVDIAAVGYLGLGAQQPIPELGNMLASGIDIVYISSSKAIIPGIAMIVLISSIQLVGHGLYRILETGIDDASRY